MWLAWFTNAVLFQFNLTWPNIARHTLLLQSKDYQHCLIIFRTAILCHPCVHHMYISFRANFCFHVLSDFSFPQAGLTDICSSSKLLTLWGSSSHWLWSPVSGSLYFSHIHFHFLFFLYVWGQMLQVGSRIPATATSTRRQTLSITPNF